MCYHLCWVVSLISCFPHVPGKIKIILLLRIGGIINMCLRQECLHVLPFVLGCYTLSHVTLCFLTWQGRYARVDFFLLLFYKRMKRNQGIYEVVRIMDNLQTPCHAPCIACGPTTPYMLLKPTTRCMQRGSGKHLSELSNWVAYSVTTLCHPLCCSWLTPSVLLNQGGSETFERIERLSSI